MKLKFYSIFVQYIWYSHVPSSKGPNTLQLPLRCTLSQLSQTVGCIIRLTVHGALVHTWGAVRRLFYVRRYTFGGFTNRAKS